MIATDADVKQVITSWLQTPNSSVFTLEYKPWYRCGANAEMVVVTTFRSDVYCLLHMCHVLIKVTVTFRHESVCTLFLESFCIQEERAKLREGVPYVKLYRYNPKHLYPKLNGYGDNGKRSLKL